jgi:Protein of unknown function (DUF3568)
MGGWGRPGGAAGVLAGALCATGCLVAAAGAGAGGGIYFTQRGAEGVVAASVERVADAADHALDHFKIKRTKIDLEREDGREKREISGEATERHEDVTVTITARDSATTRVQVVVKKSAVTWDKDFARAVLREIVARTH